MKTALIIPLKNQDKYISRMVHAINIQTQSPDIVYFVVDRPSEPEFNKISETVAKQNRDYYNVIRIDEIPEYIGNRGDTEDKDLFLTGDRRNRSIEMAISDGCDHFIFIDGDCIPQRNLVKSHRSAMGTFPTLSVGRRRESRYKNNDQRDTDEKVMNKKLFKSNGTIINDISLLASSSIVWSCNISMNLATVKRVKYINKLMYNREEVFSSEFSGKWGGEDTFLGVQAFVMKTIICSINDEYSGVNHIDHPRPISKYDPDVYNDYLCDKLSSIEDYFTKEVTLNVDILKDADL
jgi:hypothetical protein